MLDEIYKATREQMQKTVDNVTREFRSVRTGKASTQLLDTVKVEVYGSVMPLNQVATISAPEPRLLVVQAFDKTTVGDIVKGIQKADIGLNPSVDGAVIRLPVPALNEERRKDLVKQCKHLAEDGRIACRNIRREVNDQLKKAQKDKEISEDQEADGHDEVQSIINEMTSAIDKMLVEKEKDVMEV